MQDRNGPRSRRTVAAWTIDWTHELVEQLDLHWTSHLRPRLDALTDEQYLWEPVAGCWSVRPRAEATTPDGRRRRRHRDRLRVPGARRRRRSRRSPGAWATSAIGIFGDAGRPTTSATAASATRRPTGRSTAAGGLALLDRHHDAWIDGRARPSMPTALGPPVSVRPRGPSPSTRWPRCPAHQPRGDPPRRRDRLLRDLYAHRTGGHR